MVDAQGHRKILIIAVIFLAAVLAVPGVPSVAQTRGGELRLGLQSEPLGLDPHLDTNKTSINYIEHLYSGLVQLDAKLNPVPDLATGWKQHNPTTYEFTLRRGVKFHSGRELTSEDVKYTLQRAVDPNVKSAKADYFKSIKEIQTPDPYTVRITLAQPFAPFLTYLAMPGTAGIVAKETVERHGNLKRVANGTGPFMFEEWAPGRHIKMVRNPSYYNRALPRVDRLTFNIVPDEKMLTAQLRAKQLDWVEFYDVTEIDRLKRLGFQVMGGATVNWRYLAFNAAKKPFDDPRVRLAIAVALDRQAVAKTAFFGFATPATASATAPPGTYAFANAPMFTQPDLEKAKRLLAEAGHGSGFRATAKFPVNWPVYLQMAQPVQAQLKALGIELELQPLDWGLLTKDLAAANFEIVISGWTGFMDPDEQLYNVFHSKGGLNSMRFKDPQVDAFLEQGRTTVNRAERERIYVTVQRRIMELAPHVFLVHAHSYFAAAPHAKGFEFTPKWSYVSFREMWLER